MHKSILHSQMLSLRLSSRARWSKNQYLWWSWWPSVVVPQLQDLGQMIANILLLSLIDVQIREEFPEHFPHSLKLEFVLFLHVLHFFVKSCSRKLAVADLLQVLLGLV